MPGPTRLIGAVGAGLSSEGWWETELGRGPRMARERSSMLRGLANSPGPACLRTEEREQARERMNNGARTCQRDRQHERGTERKGVRGWMYTGAQGICRMNKY